MKYNNIAIYTLVSGTSGGPTLHHLLNKISPQFGPSLYSDNLIDSTTIHLYKRNPAEFYSYFEKWFTDAYTGEPDFDYELGTNIVIEKRDVRDVVGSPYEIHQDSLRRMTNAECKNGYSEVLDDYFNSFTDVENRVWSNYYGAFDDPVTYPKCDKLILSVGDLDDEVFDYVAGRALYPATPESIDFDSELWWKDHVYMDGKDVGLWKEIWFTKYHDRIKEENLAGNIKYFWQVNFLHWDLLHAIKSGSDQISIKVGFERLFEDAFHDRSNIRMKQQELITHYNKNNVDFIVMPFDWWNYLDDFKDYLGIDNINDDIIDWVEVYKAIYYIKRQVYLKYFWKYLAKHHKRIYIQGD